MDSRFDDLLHTIIVEKGQGVYGFLETVMGFLYRRTDFFYEMAPGENMGFFPGQSEAIVYNFFRKYQNLHYKERKPKRDIDPKEIEDYIKKQKESKGIKENKLPQEMNHTLEKNTDKVNLSDVKLSDKNDITENNNNTTQNTISLSTENSGKINIDTKEEIKLKPNTTNPKTEVKIDPVFSSISTYNGDTCDNYNWSQGVRDITIQFKLPESNVNKKMVIIF